MNSAIDLVIDFAHLLLIYGIAGSVTKSLLLTYLSREKFLNYSTDTPHTHTHTHTHTHLYIYKYIYMIYI